MILDPTVSGCPNEVKIVDRNDWFAKPSSTTLTPLNLPSKRVIIAHTASESCASEVSTSFDMQWKRLKSTILSFSSLNSIVSMRECSEANSKISYSKPWIFGYRV